MKFLFAPDFSKVTPSTVLVALGQAFFSLSIGIGTMVTYASYFKPDTNLRHTALNVTILDTLVAVLAGVVIFPAVFSVGIEPSSGPSLVFITLPGIFNDDAAEHGLVVGILPAAGRRSAHLDDLAARSGDGLPARGVAPEPPGRGMARRPAPAIALAAAGVAVAGRAGSGWNICGLRFFDSLDFLTANILLPAGGFFTCIFVGWKLDRQILRAEITNNGAAEIPHLRRCSSSSLRYVCPAVLLLIFLDNLGLFYAAARQ